MAKTAKQKKKSVSAGIAFIMASFNNTTVTITDMKGDTLCWASGGTCGFKGSRKGTPFAGQCAAQQAAEKAAKFGVKDLEVRVRGPGSGSIGRGSVYRWYSPKAFSSKRAPTRWRTSRTSTSAG